MKLATSISLSAGEERIEREDGPIRREDGDLRFGGVGSGCQGPNCGRHSTGQKSEWVHAGLAKLVRAELVKAGYKIQVYGKIPDLATGKKFSLGEQHTYQHPEGHRATVSVGVRPKDNYWAVQHADEGHQSGKLYELGRVRKLLGAQMDAAGQGGWQYGFRHPVGYVPQRTLSGMPKLGKVGHSPGVPAIPKGPGVARKPNPSMGQKQFKGPGLLKPTHSLRSKSEAAEPPVGAYSRENNHERDHWFNDPAIKADFDGEPSGTMQHAHLDPLNTFHPPSLTKRGKADHVPVDDVGETDDRFGDVTKRNSKDTWEQRMKLLKRSAPGGAPAQIPARTTLIPTHQGSYLPSAMMSAQKVRPNQRPINWDKQAHQKVSYARRGCI